MSAPVRPARAGRGPRALARGLLLAGGLAACGGGAARPGRSADRPGAARLEPVAPAAARDFEAAMRALRLGGPDAVATARARLTAALGHDRTLWEAWHDLGVLATREGDDAAAVEAFTRALTLNPVAPATRLARAEAHRRAGHAKEARADFEAVIREAGEDDPLRRDAATRLAATLRDAGSYDAAVEVLRDAVRRGGVDARVYTELGLTYLAQRRDDLAQLVLAKALELDAKDPAIYNAFALLALRQGRAQEAFERFDRAVELDAAYVDARFNKAAVLLDAGDHARARGELAAILDQHPDDQAARVALGVALRGLGDFPAARAAWERVIAEAPRRSAARADALFDLALLQIDFLEDVPGGKATLERYLQEAPSDHPKRQAAADKRKELGR